MGVYTALKKVPIIGTITYIANSYAFGGDRRAKTQFAPLRAWARQFLVPVLISVGLSLTMIWSALAEGAGWDSSFNWSALDDFAKRPGELAVAVLPGLLGFGIGVYALIFALASSFVRDFAALIGKRRAANSKHYGSVLVLNADMAWPLVAIALATITAIFQRKFATSPMMVGLSWFAFWYAICATIELIGVLFGLANNSLSDKASTEDPPV